MIAARFFALALVCFAGALVLAAPAGADFGFLPAPGGFRVAALDEDGAPTTQAGAHPDAVEVDLAFNAEGGVSTGDLRDLTISAPPGFLINPTVIGDCLLLAFHTPRSSPFEASASGESCPNSTQVGVAKATVGEVSRYFGIFSLATPFGSIATYGLSPFGVPLTFAVHQRETDSGLDFVFGELSQSFDLQALELTMWGTPWQGTVSPPEPGPEEPLPTGHNPLRGNCLNGQTGGSFGNCLVFDVAPARDALIKSLLTMPTTPCGQPPTFTAIASSWQGDRAEVSTTTPALEKCNKPLSTPKVQLMTNAAASRTGLAFNLAVNDGGGITNPGGIARPAIKKTVIALPEGLTINPSLGAGLGTCSEAEFARETAASEEGAGCPNSSKIGTVTVDGTLGLPEPLTGAVYLAAPRANPFDSLLALYILARNPRRGLVVKSVGKLDPDPRSGRLTATFDQLPRLLYTHFALTLREGQRSTLVSPPACGAYKADMDSASWAEPGVFRRLTSTFVIARGAENGPCPSGGVPPFDPGLLAGSINPSPATYTPFYLRMTRTDAEQEITSYSATLPEGLLGNLSGIPDCPDAAIAAARGRTGVAELASPSCPAASLVGHTIAGYGVGGVLAYAPGNLFLAGPYRGAPLSIVAIDSALVGPFDLGVVVVRSALRIDPRTARVRVDSAGSDPIPHILGGIPLHLRDIRVAVDRPAFTNTPTSCDPTAVVSHLSGAGTDLFSSADDAAADTTQRYQLLGCSALGFKPKLALALRGQNKQGRYPSLRATYTARPGDANLGKATVTLPPSLFLAQEHLDTICTRAQFAAGAGNGAECPAGSVIGHAAATTPLLDQPLRGTVYLRSSAHSVPDLVVALRGRGIAIEVLGRIDSRKGGIRTSFEVLPDAPVSKFTLSLLGAKRSLLVNSEDLCASPQSAKARFIAQNNDVSNQRPRLRAKCGKRAKPSPKRGGR